MTTPGYCNGEDKMAYEKRIYKRSDLVSVNTNSAPSLDIPALSIDGFYMPKDGGKLMVFYASVKKGWVPDGGCPVCKKTDKLIRSGTTKPRQIRDVMRNNYNIIIVLQPARMECTRCKQRFTPAGSRGWPGNLFAPWERFEKVSEYRRSGPLWVRFFLSGVLVLRRRVTGPPVLLCRSGSRPRHSGLWTCQQCLRHSCSSGGLCSRRTYPCWS